MSLRTTFEELRSNGRRSSLPRLPAPPGPGGSRRLPALRRAQHRGSPRHGTGERRLLPSREQARDRFRPTSTPTTPPSTRRVPRICGPSSRGAARAGCRTCFYLYQQRMGDHVQTGLVAGASVDEYEHDLIKKHEFTRPDKEDDRTRHIDELDANDEPVFLTYHADPRSTASWRRSRRGRAGLRLRHRRRHRPHPLGRLRPRRGRDVPAPRSPASRRSTSPTATTAARPPRGSAVAAARPTRRTPGEEAYNHFLAVIFPHDQMKIMAYNRVVKDLRGLDRGGVPRPGAREFRVRPGRPAGARRAPPPTACSSRGAGTASGAKAAIIPGRATRSARWMSRSCRTTCSGRSSASRIPRRDKRIDFVGGIRGTAELERRVRATAGRWPSRCTR